MNTNGHKQTESVDENTVKAKAMKADGASLGAIASALGETIPSVARRLR